MKLNRVRRVNDAVSVRRALISVADKTGLDDFIRRVWEIIPDLNVYSTGGTYAAIAAVAEAIGLSDRVVPISDYTGQPEMQGGLVKTLDYRIYAGLLSETFNPAHERDIARVEAVPFDVTICNFYPFERTAAEKETTAEDLRTHIDIGGPTMLRASAKNFLRVAALCDPADYASFLEEIDTHNGATTLAWRADYALRAFRYTARYESAIARALADRIARAEWESLYEYEERTP
ncbi:MAG: hypothetical protein MI724_00510 [Spirochaetales bacterium]|nr:hypothetical protein [Spirochaetales bacterium]